MAITDKKALTLLKQATEPKQETSSQKRTRVLREGVRVEYIVCPLCLQNRVIVKHNKGRVRFNNLDFSRNMLQVRYGGGKSSGFYLDEDESKTFDEIKGDPKYADLFMQIKESCKKILQRM